jgi:ribosome-associated toxin RatA of RatAB toxin-antitoxin module
MTEINRHALVPYTAAQMFALVDDIETYPDFLPWCTRTHIISRDKDEVRATIALSKSGVSKEFTTCNRTQQDKMIEIQLLEGPFKHLQGFWRFDPLGDEGCKISLDMEFEFGSKMMSMVLGPVFSQIASSLVEAFEKRAMDVYGRG